MDRLEPLLDADRIAARVRALAREVAQTWAAEGAEEVHLVVVLKGAVVFAVDLMRALHEAGAATRLDFLGLGSYGDGTAPQGDVELLSGPTAEVEGRDLLLVDDILDTGRSLGFALRLLEERGASRVRTCVLLDKPARREVPLQADFVGFRVPDRFLVGYGLDHAERHRGLPWIGALEEQAPDRPTPGAGRSDPRPPARGP